MRPGGEDRVTGSLRRQGDRFVAVTLLTLPGVLAARTALSDRLPSGMVRVMNDPLKRITVDPAICHGKPTVRGLRYPVSMILELLAGNMTPEQILADYPDLERDDICACLAFAARLANVHRILPLAA